jgi:hypothetical protein
MSAPAPNLHELATAWRIAKDRETQANAERLDIEAAMLSLLPSKLEGAVTVDGVTASYKVNRKVDTEALKSAWTAIPEAVQSAFKWEAKVDTRAFRFLDPDLMRQAQEYITSTPAKPTITVKEGT